MEKAEMGSRTLEVEIYCVSSTNDGWGWRAHGWHGGELTVNIEVKVASKDHLEGCE